MKEIYTDFDNQISSTAHIGPNVTIGKGNTIGEFTVIKGNVTIGDNNYIGPHVVIGEPAEYKDQSKRKFEGRVTIGDGNRISEFVAIQASFLTKATFIGFNNYIMHGCHIAHDCIVTEDVSIAPLTSLGGSVTIGIYANLGQGVIIHPRLTVFAGAMIGMNATVTKDVPAWQTWVGSPAKFLKINERGMEKHNIKPE